MTSLMHGPSEHDVRLMKPVSAAKAPMRAAVTCARSRALSTARVSSRKYFIPGCVGRGLDLGLRIRPAPAASGNPGLAPLGIEVEKQGFRTAWLITCQKFP